MKRRPLSPIASRVLTAPRPQIVTPRLGNPPKRPIAPPPFIKIDAENERARTRESTKRADYEGGWQRVILPSNGRARVFSTTRRWRGADVFLALPSFTSNGVSPLIRLMVYAVIEGMDRVLVASGIYRHNDQADPLIPVLPSSWLCAARVAADRFDVELSFNQTPTNPGEDFVDVGVIASDELVEAPKQLGAIPLLETVQILASAGKAPTLVPGDPGYELFAVQASQITGAAPRWLHIHNLDTVNPLNLNGNAPIYSFGFPSIGHSAYVDSDQLRPFRFDTGLAAIASTTGYTTTGAGGLADVAYQLWFR
jgi:hypothetical protein